METTDRTALEGKVIPELQKIASSLGIEGTQRLRKAGLIDAIVARRRQRLGLAVLGRRRDDAGPADGDGAPVGRGREPTGAAGRPGRHGGSDRPERSRTDPAAADRAEPEPRQGRDRGRPPQRTDRGDRQQRSDRPQGGGRDRNQRWRPAGRRPRPGRRPNRGGDRNQGGDRGGTNRAGGGASSDREGRRQRPSREDRRRQREERRVREEQDARGGAADRADGHRSARHPAGGLRVPADVRATCPDPRTSTSRCRRSAGSCCARATWSTGKIRRPRDNEKYFALLQIDAVNGMDPEAAKAVRTSTS